MTMTLPSIASRVNMCLALPMPLEVVSYSSLKQWALCPRLGYLGQHLGLQPVDQPRTGALPFGSRVHLALELWGHSKWTVSPVAVWKKLMDREFEIAEELGWPHELDKESAMGQIMLEGFIDFLESEGIFASWTVISVEKKLHTDITIRLSDGQEVVVRMRGKLDLLSQRNTDGALFVEDYKTTASLTEDALQTKLDESQGPLYVILTRREAPEQWVAGFILTMLRKVKRGPSSKPPYYARHVEPYSESKLLAAEKNIRAEISQVSSVVDLLDSGANPNDVAPYRPSWACKTCPFRLPCREMQQGNFVGGERMLLDNYAVGNPLQRYEEDDRNTLAGLGLALHVKEPLALPQ